MLVELVAGLDRQLPDPRDDRFEGGDEREHDLPAAWLSSSPARPLAPARNHPSSSRAGLRPVYPWRRRNAARRCSPSPRTISAGAG